MDVNCGCSLNGPVKKYLVFNKTSVDVIKGAISLASIDLSKFVEEVTDYAIIDTDILAGVTFDTPTPFGTDYESLIFLVEYPTKDTDNKVIDNKDKYIQFQYPLGGSLYPIGKMMILSGRLNNVWVTGAGGIKIVNPHAKFSVNVKMLMIK